jgi:hypothetical protein
VPHPDQAASSRETCMGLHVDRPAGAQPPLQQPDTLLITLVQVLRILREDARDFSVG